jgi:hypothetical protein
MKTRRDGGGDEGDDVYDGERRARRVCESVTCNCSDGTKKGVFFFPRLLLSVDPGRNAPQFLILIRLVVWLEADDGSQWNGDAVVVTPRHAKAEDYRAMVTRSQPSLLCCRNLQISAREGAVEMARKQRFF